MVSNINEQINQIYDEAIQGNCQYYEAYARLHAIKLNVVEKMEALKPDVIDCIGTDGVKFHGFKIGYNSGSKNYNYDHIPEWIDAKKKLDDIQNKAKKVAALGKSEIADTKTGEITLAANITYSKDGVKVTKI